MKSVRGACIGAALGIGALTWGCGKTVSYGDPAAVEGPADPAPMGSRAPEPVESDLEEWDLLEDETVVHRRLPRERVSPRSRSRAVVRRPRTKPEHPSPRKGDYVAEAETGLAADPVEERAEQIRLHRAERGFFAEEAPHRTPVLDPRPVPDMFFRYYGANPTVDTAVEPRSTFAADVDTASYTLARSYLERSALPPEEAIRVEEFVNSFDYAYEEPREETFAVHAEAFPSETRPGYHVLHLGVVGQTVDRLDRAPANLVFVIDTSGSMDRGNRLGLVKRSLRMLVDHLVAGDTVGIVAFGDRGREILESTGVENRRMILQAIDALGAGGSTNAQEGLALGYRMAARHRIEDGINRVVLCSDGVANTGRTTTPEGILETVADEVASGIDVATIGVGMGNYHDELLERIADRGNGSYHYVDRDAEAYRVFVQEMTGTLQVIARDVKIQLELDPAVVSQYRLLGYENRGLRAEDFRDDRVDAGEVGSGHAVTALYEIKLTGRRDPLGTLRVRWQEPGGWFARETTKELPRTIVRLSPGEASSPARLSAVVAGFAEKLRGSYWSRTISYDDLIRRLRGLRSDPEQVRELGRLIDVARRLDRRGDRFAERVPLASMSFDHVPVLR